MTARTRSLLVVGLDPEVLARLPPLLWRSAFEVTTPSDVHLATQAISQTSYSLIIVGFPLPGVEMQDFLDEIRAFGSRCRSSGMLAICEPGQTEAAARFIGRGLNKIASRSDSDATLATTIAELLHVAPRAAVRADVTLKVEISGRERSILSQTVNLSRSGMLVRAAGTMEPGERLEFTFKIPASNRSVSGVAEVVRITSSPNRPSGTGLRFVFFHGDSGEHLRRYLESALVY